MTKEPYTKPDTKAEVLHKEVSLRQAAEQALEALAWGQVDDAKEALQVALSTEGNTKRNLVKTYCGGKPNYCVDGVNMSQECVDETAKDRLVRIMGTFDLATGHADTMDQALDSLEEELSDVLGYLRARREWVGLTKEEFEESVDGLEDLEDCWVQIEAKLREKNI